jgi:hypothetical protein
MKNSKTVKVNESIAELFYDQVMGDHNGHMANIPNNPVLQSICRSSGVSSRQAFRDFLRDVADNLKKDFEENWEVPI